MSEMHPFTDGMVVETAEVREPQLGTLETAAPGRPWSADCVHNLWYNINQGLSNEQTAEETHRDVRDVNMMIQLINRVGYERLHKALVVIEHTDLDPSDEFSFLDSLEIARPRKNGKTRRPGTARLKQGK